MKSFQFTIDGRKFDTTVNEINGGMAEVTVNGTIFHVAINQAKSIVSVKPTVAKTPSTTVVAKAGGDVAIKSPLPGSIVKVVVSAGQTVKKGDLLLTMESMKMENNVTSEYSGTIKSVLVQPGQNVMQDDKLVEIETAAVDAAPAAPKVEVAKPVAEPKVEEAKPTVPETGGSGSGKKIVSPLPGSIIKVMVSEGQSVKKGDTLLTLESMKMENAVQADCDGVVSKIAVVAGQNVMQDDLLVVLG